MPLPPTLPRLRVRSAAVDAPGDLLARVPDEVDPREVVAWLREGDGLEDGMEGFFLSFGNSESIRCGAVRCAQCEWRGTSLPRQPTRKSRSQPSSACSTCST